MLHRPPADAKLERIRALPLFAGSGRAELSEATRLLDEVSVPAGRVLMHEGRPGWEALLVAEGEAVVEVHGREVARVGPGAVLGEMALLGDHYRSATTTARRRSPPRRRCGCS